MLIDKLADGGKERRLIELLKGLSDAKEIVYEVVVLSDLVTYEEAYQLKGEIHCIRRKSKKDLTVFKQLYDICKSFGPDIIQAWESMASIYGIVTAKRIKSKFINASITNAPEKIKAFSKLWLRSRLTFPFSDAIIGNSEAGLDSYQPPKAKSYCIRNGFDFKRIEGLTPENNVKERLKIGNERVIGMVAAFNPKKDYKSFVLASSYILEEKNNVIFICVGEGHQKEDIKKLVPSKYASRFRFLDWQKKVESVINIFDIGVLSSYSEGISNAIMEYMVLGLPVVATRAGGTKELVVDGETGFLVEKNSPDKLAGKLKILLDDPERAELMGRKGKERIYNQFSLDKMVTDYIRLYKHLIYGNSK